MTAPQLQPRQLALPCRCGICGRPVSDDIRWMCESCAAKPAAELPARTAPRLTLKAMQRTSWGIASALKEKS